LIVLSLGAVGVGIYFLTTSTIWVDCDGDDYWNNQCESVNQTEFWVGFGLVVGGAVVFEIVMADLLILLLRPEDPETMANPRASDRAASQFVGLVVNIGQSVGAGWNAFKHNAGSSFFFALTLFIVIQLLNFIPFVGGLLAMIVQLLGYCAYMLAYQRYMRGEQLTFSGFFQSYEKMGDGMLAILIAMFATLFAMIPSVFFGIYLSLTFSMIVCVAMDPAFAHLNSVEMMLTARKIFHYRAWKLFGFYIVSFFIMILGLLCVGIGVFAATPVIMYAHADIYYSHRREPLVFAETRITENDPLLAHVTPQ